MSVCQNIEGFLFGENLYFIVKKSVCQLRHTIGVYSLKAITVIFNSIFISYMQKSCVVKRLVSASLLTFTVSQKSSLLIYYISLSALFLSINQTILITSKFFFFFTWVKSSWTPSGVEAPVGSQSLTE